MVELRAQNSGEARDGDHGEGIGLPSASLEIGLKNVRGGNQCQSDHETEGGNGQRTEVEIRNHRVSGLVSHQKYTRGPTSSLSAAIKRQAERKPDSQGDPLGKREVSREGWHQLH